MYIDEAFYSQGYRYMICNKNVLKGNQMYRQRIKSIIVNNNVKCITMTCCLRNECQEQESVRLYINKNCSLHCHHIGKNMAHIQLYIVM